MTALLDVRGITKRFGGVTALSEVDLHVDEGEVVGLVGPNGAGKTTLFDCATGMARADAGHVRFAGKDLSGVAPHRRARLGIARTFQRMELFPGMTPRDHLLISRRASRGTGSLWQDLLNRSAPSGTEAEAVGEVLDRVGLAPLADAPVESLTLGQCRLVELARALVTEPRLLLLDEPSSGLDQWEAMALGTVIDEARRERGTAVLLVEHDLELVLATVGRVVVLDHGQVVADGAPGAVMAMPAVRLAYLGVAE